MAGDYDYRLEVREVLKRVRYMDESKFRETINYLTNDVVWVVESAWNLTDADRPRR